MKYVVSVAINGRIDVEVDAQNFIEAGRKAEIEAGDTNWNCMDLVSIEPVNATDEYGFFIDY